MSTMPVNKLMSVVAAESQRAKCVVIGEDLGTVPEGFRDKLWAANMLSYRVLWFEQNEQDYAPPESYPRQAAVCLSSHDLLPFRGWEQTVPPDEREKLVRAVSGTTSITGDLLADAHEFVARTPCAIMLVQADDLSGETEPLNVPGTDKERPNWRRRLSLGSSALADLPATRAVLARPAQGRTAAMSKPFKVEIVSREVLSKFWSTVTKITIDYTSRAGTTQRLVREINDHGMAAAVLAHDPRRNTVLLVKQMRIAAFEAGYTGDMLEVCAGLLDGDAPDVCALKEAREELGYRLHDLEFVSSVFASPGALTERVDLFMGRYGPDDKLHGGGGLDHEVEDIEVVEMPFDDAYGLIASGGIVDAKTIILLQHLKLKR